MDNLKFYIIPDDYVKNLQKVETSSRGFSCVPNLDYGKNRKQKFVCGVVFKINNYDYFAPITSYKTKKPDNFLIYDEKGKKVLSSLRFNFMFPVPFQIASVYQFNNISDDKYRSLVLQEYHFCKKNQNVIRHLAERTYKRVLLGKNKGLVKNSCDFKLLETAYKDYCIQNNISNSPINFRYIKLTSEEFEHISKTIKVSKEEYRTTEEDYILRLSEDKANKINQVLLALQFKNANNNQIT